MISLKMILIQMMIYQIINLKKMKKLIICNFKIKNKIYNHLKNIFCYFFL